MYSVILLFMLEYKIKNKFLNPIASLFGRYICCVYFDSYYIIFRLEILFRKSLKSEIE